QLQRGGRAMTLSRREFVAGLGAALAGSVTGLRAQATSADLILYNGKVVTVDDAFSIREAIVIKNGRIAAVGGNELRTRYTAERAIDLRGRMVMPGFHDTHIHLAGHSRRYIDLNDTTSLEQLKQQVSEKAKEMGPGEWITGSGWDEYHFREERKPLRGDLDSAAPNNTVVLTRAGGPRSVGNSEYLPLAEMPKGITHLDQELMNTVGH